MWGGAAGVGSAARRALGRRRGGGCAGRGQGDLGEVGCELGELGCFEQSVYALSLTSQDCKVLYPSPYFPLAGALVAGFGHFLNTLEVGRGQGPN